MPDISDNVQAIFDEIDSQESGAQFDTEDKSSTARLNGEYAFTLLDGKDFILNTDNNVFSPVSSIKNYLANQFAYDEEGKEIGKDYKGGFVHFAAFDVWMKSPERRTYSEIVFDPSESHKPHQYNLWRGMSIEPVKGDCRLIINHIQFVWCRNDHEAFNYVMKWLARMVQKPAERAGSIITLHSDEGAGKGVILDMLAEYFKHHSLVATHPRDITGRFNDKLGTSVFVSINEAVWGGKKEEEGILKSLATDPTISIEKKFIQPFSVGNCTHTIISSNNDWYAPLDKTDRRYLTLKLDNSVCGDHKYFDALVEQIESGGKGAFLEHLLNLDISGFVPKDIPKINIEERARLKNKGLGSLEKWFIDLLDGEELTTYEPEDTGDYINGERWELEPIKVKTRVLKEDYQRYAKGRNLHSETDTALGTFLKQELGFERKKFGVSPNRTYGYILPQIEDCKKLITMRLGGDTPFSH